MTAAWSLVTPMPGEGGYVFGIAADERKAQYVFQGGVDTDEMGLDSDRIERLRKQLKRNPKTPDEWIGLAASSTGYPMVTPSTEAENFEAAVEAATRAIEAQPVQEANPTRAPGQPAPREARGPQTRAELLAYQADAYDEWARQYPEVADGDEHNPDAELELRHLMTPPVNPDRPHAWLPIAVDETDCGFCERPESDAIHQATTDTITRGAN